MLAQRRRRWVNISPALGQSVVCWPYYSDPALTQHWSMFKQPLIPCNQTISDSDQVMEYYHESNWLESNCIYQSGGTQIYKNCWFQLYSLCMDAGTCKHNNGL